VSGQGLHLSTAETPFFRARLLYCHLVLCVRLYLRNESLLFADQLEQEISLAL
jgi:hypothetical protein